MDDTPPTSEFSQKMCETLNEFFQEWVEEHGEDSVTDIRVIGTLEAIKLQMAVKSYSQLEDPDDDFRIGGPLR